MGLRTEQVRTLFVLALTIVLAGALRGRSCRGSAGWPRSSRRACSASRRSS